MKKSIYTFSNFRKTTRKFGKLQTRISNMIEEGSFWDLKLFERNAMFRKLKILFKRLQKFKVRTGVKIAGATLAYTLLSNAAFSQPFVERTGFDNPFANKENPFTDLLSGDFGTKTLNLQTLVDIDNDGDLDLISGHSIYADGPKNFEFNEKGIQKKTFNLKSKGPFDFQIDLFKNKGTASEPEFEKIDGTDNPFSGLEFPYMRYSQVIFADLDGDGDLDFSLNALNYDSNSVFQYFENTGTAEDAVYTELTGTDNPLSDFEFGSGNFNHDYVDIDGDGDLDLIIGQSGIIHFENTGDTNNPAFTEVTGTTAPFYGIYGYLLQTEFVDIDDDGDLDLFVTDIGNPYDFDFLTFYENVGDNTTANFQETVSPFYGMSGYAYFAYSEFADIDDDGDYDVLFDFITYQTYYYGTDPLHYFRNDGDAGSPDFTEISNGGVTYASRPELIDIDNDGDLDMVVGGGVYTGGGYAEGELLFFENQGTAVQKDFVLIEQSSSPFNGLTYGNNVIPRFVDLDNDGDYDLVISSYIYEPKAEMVTYYENTGDAENPVFEEASANPLSAIYSSGFMGAGDIAFADIDGDGDFDIFAQESFSGNNYITLFTNIGDAENPDFFMDSCGNPFYNENFDQIFGFDFADFDNDGDIDLLIGTYNNIIDKFSISYFDNAGDSENPLFDEQIGSNNPFSSIENPGFTPFPEIGDIDNDGDNDLVTGEYYGGLNYFENFYVPPVSVNELNSDVLVYPNPSDAMFFVKMNNIQNIKVWNVNGQMLFNESINTNDYMLDLSEKPSGLYFIKLIADGKEYTHKIILK